MRQSFIIIQFFLFTICYSNDSVFKGNGETLKPVQATDVQMVSELIYITYTGDNFNVEVTATFKNHGSETDLRIGFPFDVYYPGIEDDSLYDISKEYNPNFQVTADGILLQSKPQFPGSSSEYNVVYLFNLHFDQNETIILNHKYSVGGSNSSIGDWDFKYIMETGSLWYDNIESIAIVLEIPIENVTKFQTVSPKEHAAFQQDDKIFLTWKFQNIKPTFNLELGGLPFVFNNQTVNEFFNTINEFLNPNENGYMGYMGDENKRYYKNLIFAIYGYPFKNPFV